MTPELAAEPFPLSWPTGTPRAKSRRRSLYQNTSIVDSVAGIRYRLGKMGAKHLVVSSNLPLNRHGLPSSSGSDRIRDPGVAVYFTRAGRDSCIACDVWLTVGENLRALFVTAEALASIERSGSAQLVDAAFAGFARLPAQAGPSVNHWTVVLGITEPTTNLGAAQRIGLRERVEHAYRELARRVHPDVRGGSDAAMVELNRAIEDARRDLA